MIIFLIGTLITIIAATLSALHVRRTSAGKVRQEKILAFILYFWLLMFMQLVVVSLLYALLKR